MFLLYYLRLLTAIKLRYYIDITNAQSKSNEPNTKHRGTPYQEVVIIISVGY